MTADQIIQEAMKRIDSAKEDATSVRALNAMLAIWPADSKGIAAEAAKHGMGRLETNEQGVITKICYPNGELLRHNEAGGTTIKKVEASADWTIVVDPQTVRQREAEAMLADPECQPVTAQMVEAGMAAFQAGEDDFKASDVTMIYRAMAALAPDGLAPVLAEATDTFQRLQLRVDSLHETARRLYDERNAARADAIEAGNEIRRLRMENLTQRDRIEGLEGEAAAMEILRGHDAETIASLSDALMRVNDQGKRDYIGPTETVETTAGPVKQAVPDPVHENFHRAIGDVIDGKVMSGAREQMRKALDSVPKEKAPFPVKIGFGDPRRIGG
jgi:hypothetical protein